MKPNNHHKLFILMLFLFGTAISKVYAQDSSVAEPSVTLRYFIINNSVQYLVIQSGLKVGKKIQPLPRQAVQLYLDTNSVENLIMKIYTDENGKAKVIIPPVLKDKWINNPKHNFIAVMEAGSPKDERTTTLEITKAKIVIDTSNNDGIRTVNVKAMFFENNDWVPAKDVEMKIGVNRQGGILSAGDEETYTTDSTGNTTIEFKKDSLPGDQLGNIVLVAKVEDNDQYGNLLVEKTVPWGVSFTPEKNFFDQRTLWSTRFHTPYWLLFMAYFIVISVWATIFYLIMQIIRIKKLGTTSSA